jgi:hypothetical protein
VVYRNLSPTFSATRCDTPDDREEPTPEEIAEALGGDEGEAGMSRPEVS